jgi:hypothetical protein
MSATAPAAATKTETPNTPPPAAAAPDQETVEREKRVSGEKATRAKAKRLFDAFKSEAVGLSPFSASLLAAHVYSTVEKAEDMTVKAATDWALDFRRTHPVVWGTLINQNSMGFLKQLKLHGLDQAELSEDYARLGSVIQA